MVDRLDGPLVPLQDRFLNLRGRCSFSTREIEHRHTEFFQVVVFADPVISDDEHVDV